MVTLMGRSPSDGQHKNLGLEKAAGNEMPGTKQEAEVTEEGKINSEVEVWKKKKKKKKKKGETMSAPEVSRDVPAVRFFACAQQRFRGGRNFDGAGAATCLGKALQYAPDTQPTANQRRGFSNMRYGFSGFLVGRERNVALNGSCKCLAVPSCLQVLACRGGVR